MRKVLLLTATALGIAGLTSGCVSNRGYEGAVDRIGTEQSLNDSLSSELLATKAKNAEYEKSIVEWEAAYNRLLEISKADKKTEVVVKEVPGTDAFKGLSEQLGKGLTGLEGDWNVLRTDHAIGVRLDDGGDLLFLSGSWKLTDKASKNLAKLAALLKTQLDAHPEYVVRIDGHTDSDPVKTAKKLGVEDNIHLGFLRANAVREFLGTQGLSDNRMFIFTGGEYLPVGNEKNRNRRVEVWMSTPQGFSLSGGKSPSPTTKGNAAPKDATGTVSKDSGKDSAKADVKKDSKSGGTGAPSATTSKNTGKEPVTKAGDKPAVKPTTADPKNGKPTVSK